MADYSNIVEAAGCYQFKINYSKTKDMGIGQSINLPKFRVGQHDWRISYYPQGDKGKYISVYLELQKKYVDVTTTFEFTLLDVHGNVPPYTSQKSAPTTFTTRQFSWGFVEFVERTKLEETYVKDGYFVLNVKVTLKDESSIQAHWNTCSTGFLRKGLQKFREENKCTDVSFNVNGEIFDAHRLILAAHSPVWEAKFFGPMAESNIDRITINEMMPSVFKAMLDFMYNDSFSGIKKPVDGEEPMSSTVFLQHLLEAADFYAIEKLKAICEYQLIQSISLDTVLSTLELAERHNCSKLKKHCLLLVVDKDNLVSLVITEEYIKLMQNCPSPLAELKDLLGK